MPDAWVLFRLLRRWREGRPDARVLLLIPALSPLGHAIEAGWMLLLHARARGDMAAADEAIDGFMLGPLDAGWDSPHGGLLAFHDADGLCPTQVLPTQTPSMEVS